MAIRYRFRKLLALLYPHAPEHIHTVRRSWRKTHNGLLSVGLKIHALNGGPQFGHLIGALGGRQQILGPNQYRRTGEVPICWVIPAVGNVDAAISFLEALEIATQSKIFHNPDIQIQVCSPGRLSAECAGLLSIGFCLGSDMLRNYTCDDLETTFSDSQFTPRGRRITLYDGLWGTFDRNFDWWGRYGDELRVSNLLPFRDKGRTDILTATSPTDLRNINLISSLLIHEEWDGYWNNLGLEFMAEMFDLLSRHMLLEHLNVHWIRNCDEESADDAPFEDALRVLMAYAFEDAARVRTIDPQNPKARRMSILLEMQDILSYFRAEIVNQAAELKQGGNSYDPL